MKACCSHDRTRGKGLAPKLTWPPCPESDVKPRLVIRDLWQKEEEKKSQHFSIGHGVMAITVSVHRHAQRSISHYADWLQLPIPGHEWRQDLDLPAHRQAGLQPSFLVLPLSRGSDVQSEAEFCPQWGQCLWGCGIWGYPAHSTYAHPASVLP